MSTELKTHSKNPVKLTRYYNGEEEALQLTDPRVGYINNITREEAFYLALDILKFHFYEEELHDGDE